MSATTSKRSRKDKVIIVKKMKDYSKEPVFRKKTEDAIAFLKKNGLPVAFKKKER